MELREKIYTFIREYISEHGYSPSIRDIENATGAGSTAQVAYHVNKLVIQGRITYTPGLARTIRLVAK